MLNRSAHIQGGEHRAHVISELEGELREEQRQGGDQADFCQGLAHAVAGALRKGDVSFGLPVVPCDAHHRE